MELLTLEQVAIFCGAPIPENSDTEIYGISRDNRTLSKGDLFIAIAGACFDGHEFVREAAAAGAAAAMVSRDIPDCPIPLIRVQDTAKGLCDLASGYRELFHPHVIGITGSVGKTTTKEMVASVLSEQFYTLKTQGNLNNEIGLPFTVMGLNRAHEAAVIEMGTNHFGEISRLTRIAKPDIAIITAIGESHIEFLGSKEGVRRAKLEILEGLPPSGCVVLNGDDPLLWQLNEKIDLKTVYFGTKNPKVSVLGEVVSKDWESTTFTVRGLEDTRFIIHAGGEHNLRNALSAVAIGLQLGLSAEQIRQGLLKFVNTGMRQKIHNIGGITVINDCYNASPDSMRAALCVLGDGEGRRIALLGDMLELGEASSQAHYEIGKFAAHHADFVFAAGEHAGDVIDGACAEGMGHSYARRFDTVEALAEAIAEEKQSGDVLLIKGSRGMKMEQVVERLSVKSAL